MASTTSLPAIAATRRGDDQGRRVSNPAKRRRKSSKEARVPITVEEGLHSDRRAIARSITTLVGDLSSSGWMDPQNSPQQPCKASRACASTPICARGTYVKRGHHE